MIFITDMDGTLAHQGTIPLENFKALKKLKEKKIPTVVATGRNLHALKQILPIDSPIDYAIISTGVGILDWPTQKIINSKEISSSLLCQVVNLLIKNRIDFCLQRPLPGNHYFYFHQENQNNLDFWTRLHHYHHFATPFVPKEKEKIHCSQIVAIFPASEKKLFEQIQLEISKEIPQLSIVKSTSPQDKSSLWMEILPPTTNKATAVQWLQNHLSMKNAELWSIGNDFNDLDLLEISQNSYVVSDSPQELREKFPSLSQAKEAAVAELVEILLTKFPS